MRDTPLPAVLTVRDFVDWSRVSLTKAYALMAAGDLFFFKVGGRRYIRRDEAKAKRLEDKPPLNLSPKVIKMSPRPALPKPVE